MQQEIHHTVSDQASITIDGALEAILLWAQAKFGNDELITAQKDFFVQTGQVFHDDSFYNQRMNYFQDYFLFERPCKMEVYVGRHITPYTAYLEEFADKAGALSFTTFLKSIRHSVFQTSKVAAKKMQLDDLLKQEKVWVDARENEGFDGISRGDLFQGFIYITNHQTFISKGLIIHPRNAVTLVKRQIKVLQKAPVSTEFQELSRLARLHLRHLRYSYIDAKRIYGLQDL